MNHLIDLLFEKNNTAQLVFHKKCKGKIDY